MTENPYAKYIAGEDLLLTLAETPRRIEAIVRAWPEDWFGKSHAPGKWTARQVLIHLAQTEMVFANRVRFALAQDDYVVQPFDQDGWMAIESEVDGRSALDAYVAIRRMNLALCRSLTPAERARTFTHPERGTIDVEWVMRMFAGHERHHLPQLEVIGS